MSHTFTGTDLRGTKRPRDPLVINNNVSTGGDSGNSIVKDLEVPAEILAGEGLVGGIKKGYKALKTGLGAVKEAKGIAGDVQGIADHFGGSAPTTKPGTYIKSARPPPYTPPSNPTSIAKPKLTSAQQIAKAPSVPQTDPEAESLLKRAPPAPKGDPGASSRTTRTYGELRNNPASSGKYQKLSDPKGISSRDIDFSQAKTDWPKGAEIQEQGPLDIFKNKSTSSSGGNVQSVLNESAGHQVQNEGLARSISANELKTGSATRASGGVGLEDLGVGAGDALAGEGAAAGEALAGEGAAAAGGEAATAAGAEAAAAAGAEAAAGGAEAAGIAEEFLPLLGLFL